MKIIVKPLTYVSLALGVGVVVALLIFQDRPDAMSRDVEKRLKASRTTLNEDFSQGFYPVIPVEKLSRVEVHGLSASGWRDWSQALQGKVAYAKDDSSQKIQFDLKGGDLFFGHELFFEAGTYVMRAEVRSSEPLILRLGVCHDYKNRTFAASKTARVGSEWQELALTTTMERHNYFILLGTRQPKATLWVRRVSITPQ